jgi:methylated-DNA-[protein]-cysteine S-methyltransferase
MSTIANKVYKALSSIPKGQVISYRELARRVGAPKAVRMVATLVGKNPNPIKVPCHRIINKNGELGNYTWQHADNPAKKLSLLKFEGVIFRQVRKVRKGKDIVVYMFENAPKGAIL